MRQPAVERERGGSKCDGDGDGDRECCAPPSRDLVATALVLAAEAASALIANDAIGGNSGVTIVGSAGSIPAFLEDYLHARFSGCGTLF